MKKIITFLKQPKIAKIIIAVFIAILTISITAYIEFTKGRISIEDSVVSAPVTAITANTPAKLEEIDVYAGQQVKKGDLIAIAGSETLYTDTPGIVSMVNNQIGNLINEQNPVAQIVRTSDMRIAGTIDENKGLKDIQVGQVVSFTIDALPGQTFWGYLDEISPSAKQSQIAFSISSERPTQQFVVYARFNANAYPAIKNGMSAKMTIYTNTNKE
jgi:multidrug resistance efflux pump